MANSIKSWRKNSKIISYLGGVGGFYLKKMKIGIEVMVVSNANHQSILYISFVVWGP